MKFQWESSEEGLVFIEFLHLQTNTVFKNNNSDPKTIDHQLGQSIHNNNHQFECSKNLSFDSLVNNQCCFSLLQSQVKWTKGTIGQVKSSFLTFLYLICELFSKLYSTEFHSFVSFWVKGNTICSTTVGEVYIMRIS